MKPDPAISNVIVALIRGMPPHCQMAESSVIMAYLDGLGPGASPQAIGNLRDDLKAFAAGGFKTALSTLSRYGGHVNKGCD